MAEFKVVFTKVAEKDINGLDPKARLRILQVIKVLETSPFPRGDTIKKLKGARISLYRLRVGDFRVVYHIDGRKIAVFFIVDIKNLEKKMKIFL